MENPELPDPRTVIFGFGRRYDDILIPAAYYETNDCHLFQDLSRSPLFRREPMVDQRTFDRDNGDIKSGG